MALRTAAIVVGLIVGGCATARTAFQPYSSTSTRAAALEQAVAVTERDLPKLAAAGAVIVGTVTARGNGFAGAEYVEEAAAVEAARHGGTHVVLGMTVHKSARGERLHSTEGAALPGTSATYYPGRAIELTALVLRLPDDASWSALPPALRPPFDWQVARSGARAAVQPVTAVAPDRDSESVPASSPEPVDIDGSHIKPLAPAEAE